MLLHIRDGCKARGVANDYSPCKPCNAADARIRGNPRAHPQLSNLLFLGALAEFSRNIVFGFFFTGVGKNHIGAAKLHHFTQIHIGSIV